jgi:hypothetical protein
MIFEECLPRVLPFARGCPDDLALQHILDAARMFCARTLVWNYETRPIPAVAGIADYTLQIGDGQDLVRVLFLEVAGTDYAVRSGTRSTQAEESESNVAMMRGAHDFTLRPAPSLDGQLIITGLAVKPSAVDTEWPDDLSDHVTDIAHGAVATLCEMPNVDWKDAATADRQQIRFNARIAAVASKVSKGMGRSRRHAAIGWF